MPRPSVPLAKDVVAIAKGLRAEGITSGMIKCADGTEIIWGQGEPKDPKISKLDLWKEKRNATS